MKKQNGIAFLKIIIVIAIICLVLGIGYMWWQKEQGNGNQANIQKEVINDSAKSQEKASQTKSKTIVDCGSNFDCFIESVQKGKDAKIKHTSDMSLFGVPMTTFMEFRDKDKFGDHTYFSRIESFASKMSDKMVQTMLSNGATRNQISSMEQYAAQRAKSVVGFETLCKFSDSEKLISALRKEEAGKFSTNDFAFAKCRIKTPKEPGTLLDNSDCLLVYPSQKISLSLPDGGVTALKISVSGFRKNGQDVSWKIKNGNIAKISASTGVKSKMEALSYGNTELTITDNAVGPNCKIVVPVVVK